MIAAAAMRRRGDDLANGHLVRNAVPDLCMKCFSPDIRTLPALCVVRAPPPRHRNNVANI